jgi:hypothetical protein
MRFFSRRRTLDVTRLESLGFFKCLDAEGARRAAALAREKNYAFAGETHRYYPADAEDLAEHGVRDFLGRVAPFLRRAGVPIEVTYRDVKVPARAGRPAGIDRARLDAGGWLDPEGASVHVESMRIIERPDAGPCEVTEDVLAESETYLLFFGDREHVVYRFEPGEAWDGWERAARATINLLDTLLAAHGSPERAHGVHGGNDFCIAFMTPEMARVINDASDPNGRLG